jgi:hypothetical protein
MKGTAALDHGRRRSAYRSSLEAEQLELGHEPPLSVDGEAGGLIDRAGLRTVVLRHHPDRPLRRGPHGRRRFCLAGGDINFATIPERWLHAA